MTEDKTLQTLALCKLTEAAREVAEAWYAGDLGEAAVHYLLEAVNSDQIRALYRDLKAKSEDL